VQAVEVDDRGNPGDSESDVRRPAPPRAAEGVGDDDADVESGELADPGS
jgi:hypothetical protein